jgi:regulation of enolase protein 1 (concanavalin A-like superfamily)
MIARVASLQNTNPWAKAGIMFRETLSPGSRFVAVVVTPSRGVALQYRDATGAAAKNVAMSLGAAPEWVRLTRTGDRFTAALSEDGLRWTVAGSAIVSMAADVRAGLPVTSHADGVLATAVFDSVSIER